MYFPEHMTFQYFFFDTYIGYFLQMLPIAVLVGLIYGITKYKTRKGLMLSQIIYSSLFVSYITGLIGLVLLLNLVGDIWYWLLYRGNSFSLNRFFEFSYNLMPDFWNHINGESVGNLIMFFPFGILYPLANQKTTFKITIVKGFACVCTIELLQPFFGRAFDINDIILNTTGIMISSAIFFAAKYLLSAIKHNRH